jgi:hypothetical protein
MTTYRVRLHKPESAARLGITLVGQADAPCISALAPACIAADSGMLSIGQKLYAVNGVHHLALLEISLRALIGPTVHFSSVCFECMRLLA